MSGGKNEGVGSGEGSGSAHGGAGASASGAHAAPATDVDLKAATVIDYATGSAIACTVAHQRNGATATGGGQEARNEAARRAARKALEVTYLANTLFLLSVTDVCFEGLKPFLSRHWTVMDIPRNRRDLESTGAGQRVIVELGCPLTPTYSASAAATAAPAGPAPTNLTSAVADGLTLAAVPHYGAFSAASFRVGPTVLKEVSTDRLSTIVTETLLLPFLVAYEAVVGHQLAAITGSNVGETAAATPLNAAASFAHFATARTADMTAAVLGHELGLVRSVAAYVTEEQRQLQQKQQW